MGDRLAAMVSESAKGSQAYGYMFDMEKARAERARQLATFQNKLAMEKMQLNLLS